MYEIIVYLHENFILYYFLKNLLKKIPLSFEEIDIIQIIYIFNINS